ncbi:MAG: hypothetical protein ILNGONEN_00549 [Syntrophorhabdaceae bacterium]|nr:hypothetical protein [Syntrophorhabdaceae bacterium]
MEALSTIVALLVTLSVASERLVEIIKGLLPFLSTETSDATKERVRHLMLQVLAIVAGIATALLARPVLQDVVPDGWNTIPGILALGLLASGGSGFWNSVLEYILKLKDIKKLELQEKQLEFNKKWQSSR